VAPSGALYARLCHAFLVLYYRAYCFRLTNTTVLKTETRYTHKPTLDLDCMAHRCMFCSMKENRAQMSIIDVEELKKVCEERAKEPTVPLEVFEDSTVYRDRTPVKDVDEYKEGGLDAVSPFGNLFQQETPFEEDVFEPECPYGEKSWLRQHPLFGDFGVKVWDCDPLADSSSHTGNAPF